MLRTEDHRRHVHQPPVGDVVPQGRDLHLAPCRERLVQFCVQVPQALRHRSSTRRRRDRRSRRHAVCHGCPLPAPARRGSAREAGRGVHEQQPQQATVEDPVAHQVDPFGQPLHRHPVVVREARRDADHPRTTPVDGLGHLRPQHLPHERLELVVRRVQPGQVGDRLGHHPAVRALLELDHHRAAVLIEPQGVDPPPVPRPGRILRGQETDAQHLLQASLDPPLQLYLQRNRRAGQLDVPSVRVLPEHHQLGHQRPLPRSLQEKQSKQARGYSGLG